MTKQQEEAYTALDTVHYKGEKTVFTFEYFTNIMTKAHTNLHHFCEPILETKKVHDRLSSIQNHGPQIGCS